jgi:DNA-binding MarR family transcriptional regulator
MCIYTYMRTELSDGECAALKEVASSCLCQKARNAARTLTRFYDSHFAGTSIEPTQFNMLVAIRLMEPVPLGKVADQLGLERTTLTRNLALLERDGLVEVVRGDDARSRQLSLTAAGRRTLQKSLQNWKQAQDAAISILGQEDFSRFVGALSLTNKFIKQKGNAHEKSK